MSEVTTRTVASTHLWTVALAMALTCATPVAEAALARVVINSFTATDTDPFDNSFLFAPTDAQFQAWSVGAATNNAASSDTHSGTQPSWLPVTATAQTSTAMANVASSSQTDPFTGLVTPNFSLTASATPGMHGLSQSAFGNMSTRGNFCFDANFLGTCNGAGSVTFDLFYDLIVDPAATPGSLATAGLNVSGTGIPNGLFFDIASTGAGDTSSLGQHFSWTVNLGAGGIASVALNGSAAAELVPEPNVLALVALGVIGFAATRRSRGAARSAA